MKNDVSMSSTFLRLLVLRLFLPTLVLILVGVAFIVFFWHQSVRSQQQQLANSVAHTLDVYLDQAGRVLTSLAHVADNVELADFPPYLQATWWSYGYFDTLYRLDATDSIELMAPYDHRYVGLDLSGQPFFASLRDNKEVNISPPFTSLRTGNPTVFMGRMLRDGGIMAGELNLSALQETIDAAVARDSRDTLFVVDASGLLLAHPDKNLVVQQTNLGHLDIVQQALSGESRGLHTTGNGLFIGATAAITGTNWLVVVQAPMQEVDAPFINTVAPVILLLLLIWMALIWTFRRRLQTQVLKPLERLGQAAVDLSAGHLEQRVVDIEGHSEIGMVAGAFNTMADRLRRRIGMENLVSGISRRFVNLPPERYDNAIRQSLRNCGRFVAADRSFVFLFSQDGTRMTNTHEWSRKGVVPQIQNLQEIDAASSPWFVETLRSKGMVLVQDVSKMPPEAAPEQGWMLEAGVGSLACVGIGQSDKLLGFLGFVTLGENRAWSTLDMDILRVVGEVIGNVLERYSAERALARELELSTALAELSKSMLSTSSMEEMGRLALQHSLQLTRSTFGLVSILAPDNETYRFYHETAATAAWAAARADGSSEAATDWSNAPTEESCRMESSSFEGHLPGGLFGRVVEQKEVLVSNDLQRDPRSKGLPPGHPPIRSFAAAPSMVEDSVMGLLAVANAPAGYNEADAAALDRLAVLFAIALRRGMAEEQVASMNRHLEQMVSERTRELLQKTRDLERANIKLTELDQMKSAFLSSVSHELRTPLTSVQGFARLVSRDFSRLISDHDAGREPEQAKVERIVHNLGIIESESKRLTRLINDVLDISKIESGRMSWNDKPLEVEDILRRAAAAVQPFFSNTTARVLSLDIQQHLPRLFMDADRLLQVCINLLDNAAKFTPSGVVTLRAYNRVENIVRIEVADTGRGVPEDELRNIFNKFHQIQVEDTLADKPRGTGLGLAICHQIIEHYGGKLWAESTLGRGSTFIVELQGMPWPATPEATPQPPDASDSSEKSDP